MPSRAHSSTSTTRSSGEKRPSAGRSGLGCDEGPTKSGKTKLERSRRVSRTSRRRGPVRRRRRSRTAGNALTRRRPVPRAAPVSRQQSTCCHVREPRDDSRSAPQARGMDAVRDWAYRAWRSSSAGNLDSRRRVRPLGHRPRRERGPRFAAASGAPRSSADSSKVVTSERRSPSLRCRGCRRADPPRGRPASVSAAPAGRGERGGSSGSSCSSLPRS